ncbi:MAG: AAA family ATPase, partial [Byssovorax sp.]
TLLSAHAWPGNVRELRSVVERAVSLGRLDLGGPRSGLQPLSSHSAAAAPSALTLPARQPGAYGEARAEALSIFEQDYLRRLIEACQGNASEAARVARMDRPHLLRLLRRHRLR